MDVLVADHADHPADERRQARHFGHAQAGDLVLHEGQRVGRGGHGFLAAPAPDDLGAVFPGGDGQGGGGPAETVTADVFAAGDRLEEKGFAQGAQAGVDGNRRLEVRHEVEADRDQVGRLGQLAEGGLVGYEAHGPGLDRETRRGETF